MKIAVLSNITADSLVSRIKTSRPGVEVYAAPGYNTWVQEFVNPASGLWNASPAAVFAVIDGTELLGDAGLASRESAESILSPLLDIIAGAAAAHPDVKFIVSSLDIPQKRVLPMSAPRVEPYAAHFWRARLEDENIPILDLSEIAANTGREKFYSERMWYLGSIPFSGFGETAIAGEMARFVDAMRGHRKKCLALDLDNTLWGGVIGEDGVDGIVLSATKEGARYRDMQKRVREIADTGAILAVVSKNNMEDALAGLDKHPDMILRSRDFAAIKANWDPKPANIAALARELNIGLDSFVFVDDNPVERESVAIALPEVAVPDFPADTSRLEAFMRGVARDYFSTLDLTGEDRSKTEQYRAESLRESAKASFGDIEEYLCSLGMAMTFGPLAEADVPRAAQLTQKTNQFNLTTRRHTEAEIAAMRQSPEAKIFLASLADKFGDYGKIALCIAAIDGGTAAIETFLMSCRVMGRGAEDAFLRSVECELARCGVKTIVGEYIATAKNRVVAGFWQRMGYVEKERDGAAVRFVKTAPFAPTDGQAIAICRASS